MSTPRSLVEVLPSRLAMIAARIEQRRRELGLTQQALAERCNRARPRLLSSAEGGAVPRMTRERIAKVLMARGTRGRVSAARALYPQELRMLAAALTVSVEWLAGPSDDQSIVIWDPITEPERAAHVAHLIAHHLNGAAELLSWAEFLPCSFETADVMHAHHAALFSGEGVPPHESARAAHLFDTVGAGNRTRALEDRDGRSWRFTHVMARAGLEALVTGTGNYRLCDIEMRRRCLAHLARVIGDASYRMRLVLADDADVASVRQQLRSFDSLFIIDHRHAMWRDYCGNLMWSIHPEIVAARRRPLETLLGRARWRDQAAALELVASLSRRLARRRPLRRVRSGA